MRYKFYHWPRSLEEINSPGLKMNRLLVFLVVLVVLVDCVYNAPVGRQRGKNKNSLKNAVKVSDTKPSIHLIDVSK